MDNDFITMYHYHFHDNDKDTLLKDKIKTSYNIQNVLKFNVAQFRLKDIIIINLKIIISLKYNIIF